MSQITTDHAHSYGSYGGVVGREIEKFMFFFNESGISYRWRVFKPPSHAKYNAPCVGLPRFHLTR